MIFPLQILFVLKNLRGRASIRTKPLGSNCRLLGPVVLALPFLGKIGRNSGLVPTSFQFVSCILQQAFELKPFSLFAVNVVLEVLNHAVSVV